MFLDQTIALLQRRGNESFARWLRKHADEPFTAGIRWIVEHFQFGACMFDPAGLKERYVKLVGWDGLWVNYWTETAPKKVNNGISHEENAGRDRLMNDYVNLVGADLPLLSADSVSVSDGNIPEKPDMNSATALIAVGRETLIPEKKQPVKQDKERSIPARHFVVRPNRLCLSLGGEGKWEKVQIAGVDDEVAAHCGLFIPGQNLDYDGLVERVGKRLLGWCETLM